MMTKTLFLALAVAFVAAESDHHLYNLGYPYSANYGYMGYRAPFTFAARPAVSSYTYAPATYTNAGYSMPYTYGAHYINKREADADAEPWWSVAGYSTPYAAYHANPTVYGGLYKQYMSAYSTPARTYYAARPAVSRYAYAPATYTTAAYSMPYTHGAHYIAKREAEADAGVYSTYASRPVTYSAPATTFTTSYASRPATYTTYAAQPATYTTSYAAQPATYTTSYAAQPATYTTSYAKPATYTTSFAQPAVSSYSYAPSTYTTSSYTTPYTTYGSHYIAKREADADAEPWWSVAGYSTPYAAYHANPTVYSGLYKQYMSTHAAPVTSYAARPVTAYAARPVTTYAARPVSYARATPVTYSAAYSRPIVSGYANMPYNYLY